MPLVRSWPEAVQRHYSHCPLFRWQPFKRLFVYARFGPGPEVRAPSARLLSEQSSRHETTTDLCRAVPRGALRLPGVRREQPRVLWIFVGLAGMGILLTLVISWRGSTSLAGGAWTDVVFGLLTAIGYDFAQYGTSNLWSLRATLADPFITAVLLGVSGAAVGYILGQARSVRPQG